MFFQRKSCVNFSKYPVIHLAVIPVSFTLPYLCHGPRCTCVIHLAVIPVSFTLPYLCHWPRCTCIIHLVLWWICCVKVCLCVGSVCFCRRSYGTEHRRRRNTASSLWSMPRLMTSLDTCAVAPELPLTRLVRSTTPSRPNKAGLSVHYPVCTYVHLSTKSLSDLNEIWYVGRGR